MECDEIHRPTPICPICPPRRYKARFEASLPGDYAPHPKGVYLIFAGSAIRLPEFGKYSVTAEYDEHAGDSLDEDIRDEPRLWAGQTTSEPVLVTIKGK